MIKHLEQKNDELNKERMALEAQIGDSDQDESLFTDFITHKVEDFLRQVEEESSSISYMLDRIRLTSILDAWDPYVAKWNPGAPVHTLKPSTKGTTWLNLSLDDLVSACRTHTEALLKHREAEGSYSPEWSVPRNEVGGWLREFLKSDYSAMALTGGAGVGKSFLIYQLAQRSLVDQTRLVLTYSAPELESRIEQLQPAAGYRLSDVIGQVLAHDLGYREDAIPPASDLDELATLEGELEHINHLLDKSGSGGSHLLICLDTVERFSYGSQRSRELLIAIDHLIVEFSKRQQKTARRVRFIIVCSDFEWQHLAPQSFLHRLLYFGREPMAKGGQGESIAWVVQPLVETEFREAFANRLGEPELEDQYKIVQSLCEGNPLLLSLAIKIIQQGQEVTKDRVLKDFYETRVRQGDQDDQRNIERFVAQYTKFFKKEIGGALAGDLDPSRGYDLLRVGGLIFQELVKLGDDKHIVLRLVPSGLAEYLVKRFRDEDSAATITRLG